MEPKEYSARDELLAGRVILVTGAGDGIGRATALRCAELGATMVLLGRTSGKLENISDEIVSAGYPQPGIAVFDLAAAQGPDYQNLIDQLEASYPRLDGLLHNAGILGDRSPIEHYDIATWQRVMHVNVNAAFILTRCCLPLLQASDDASIIFTSSGVGRKGRAYWGAYAVSKFATEGLSQVLADELENANIRVNCINPGSTRTNMRRKAYPGEDPETLPTPAEILAAYEFLLGPDSAGITGKSVNAQ